MQDEMSLLDLLKNIWQARISLFFSSVACLLIAVIFLFLTIPLYKSTMIVAPADGYALGDYASSAQYDRAAALPFWKPKDQEGASTDFYRFMHTLRGVSASQILLKDQAIMARLNKEVKVSIKTPEALSFYLNKKVKVYPLGATSLRRITYHHADPKFANALLRKLHLVADQMIRRDRRQQSQSRIEYLNNTLTTASNPEHRKMTVNLLMQQEHIQMLANLDEAYAAIIVEPASTTPKPVFPNHILVLSAALLCGIVFGYLFWFVRRNSPE